MRFPIGRFPSLSKPIYGVTPLAVSLPASPSHRFEENVPELFQEYIASADRKLLNSLDLPLQKLVLGQQVHGKEVRYVTRPGVYPQTDGFYTDRQEIYLTIRTADCAAVMVAFPEIPAVGIAHMGWRGARAEIVPNLIRQMLARWQVSPSSIQIAVSPFIKSCCYEVGAEFETYFDRQFLVYRDNQRFLDLEKFLIFQLLSLNISTSQIHMVPHCTACSSLPLYSFRRSKTTKRMFNIIYIGR